MDSNAPSSLEEAVNILRKAEASGTTVPEPAADTDVALYRRAANHIIADRLLTARNRSGLNNDKINRRLHSMYIERRREAKSWTFTNILNPRIMTLPDGEETSMLAEVLGIPETGLEIHLRTMPWLKTRKSAPKRKSRPLSSRENANHPAQGVQEADQAPSNNWIVDEKYSTPDALADHAPGETPHDWEEPMETRQTNGYKGAGDLKISHDGDNLVISGKIWCDKETAAKLRMIVPMRLINQERGDDPWCYEVRGQVHAYQLYNIIHVLYGAPQVLKVDI